MNVDQGDAMTTRTLFRSGLFATTTFISACKNDPNFCANAPLHTCSLLDAAVDAGCTSNAQCSGSAAVCDVTGTKMCEQCAGSDDTACVGTTPTCGSDDTCHACTAHADCASAACLPDGSCGTDANVAYVDPAGTDNMMCTKAMPCTKATKALATTRPFVKFHGTTDEAPMGVTVSGAQHVTFLADPGATLTRGTGGAILTVKDDNTSLAVFDLAISNAPNTASGFGLVVPTASGAPSVSLTRTTLSNNPAGGISSSGGSLTISQSTISGNAGGGISSSGGSLTISQSTISGNAGGGTGGGIFSSGAVFQITNSFIYGNGNAAASGFGGTSLAPSGSSKFEFNTVVDNHATSGALSAGGVVCDQAGFVAANNLIFRNTGGTAGDVQTIGICGYGNSFVMPGTSTVDNSPGFVHPNTQPFDYHLTGATPATILDAAGVCTGIDFDGDSRPIGNGCDLGADEFKP